jgi:2-octaprenylphenol hydroxylase
VFPLSDVINDSSFDLIIVGGGMVGAALACATAESGFQVCVLEAQAPQTEWPPQEIDLRVSALSRASQRILHNLGAWQRMTGLRVSPYTDMHVWDAGGKGSIHFSAADIGESELGHIVENRVTQLALWERMSHLPNVTLICPARVARLEFGPSSHLWLADGRILQAGLIVGADGRDSQVRRLAGIGTQGWDYDQHAIVATIRPQLHHQFTAWQRFMPTGPLALLPIEDGHCSIVWSTSPLQAQELMGLDDAAFCSALHLASEKVLGDILEVGPRGLFPLRLGHAETYIREGLALVGDAAHAIHPLAGQGVNLGFLDAATLAEVLIEGKRMHREPGAYTNLRRYERARKGANLAMLAAMDLFKRFFSNQILPLQLLRNLGLSLVDHAVPVKDLIMRRAMGLTGDLPDLAR